MPSPLPVKVRRGFGAGKAELHPAPSPRAVTKHHGMPAMTLTPASATVLGQGLEHLAMYPQCLVIVEHEADKAHEP
jgi:hypothetical protein